MRALTTMLGNTKVTIRANKLSTKTEEKLKGYNDGWSIAKELFEDKKLSEECILYIACHSGLASEAFYDGMIAYFLAPRALYLV